MFFVGPDNLRAADRARHLERDPVEMVLIGVGVLFLAGALAFKAITLAGAAGAMADAPRAEPAAASIVSEGEISPDHDHDADTDETTDDRDDRASSSFVPLRHVSSRRETARRILWPDSPADPLKIRRVIDAPVPAAESLLGGPFVQRVVLEAHPPRAVIVEHEDPVLEAGLAERREGMLRAVGHANRAFDARGRDPRAEDPELDDLRGHPDVLERAPRTPWRSPCGSPRAL